MGIPGLLPFLSNSTRDAHISEFENEYVAIDAYCWLHKGIYSCAFELATKKPTVKYVTYCMRYIEMLLHFKVKPILVFDGRQLSSKSETEKKRREDRKKKYEKGKELLRAGKTSEGRKLLGESVDVTHELALTLMKQCRQKNIDCIVAPYEADAQLAFLSLRNIAKCVITEDSDLLAYGSQRVMFKMDTSGRGKLIEKSELHFSLSMTPEEFNEDLFRYLCILIGCDYLPSLYSVGPVNALKFIKLLKGMDIYDALPKLPNYINKKNIEVPPEYVVGFKVADQTFKHQLVYDPTIRAQVPLRPVKSNDDIVGTKLPEDTAFNLAVGNIDPMTMKVVDNYDPNETGKGFTLLWRTDSLPNAIPRKSYFFPEAKKRQREILDSNSAHSVTNDVKKQRTPLNFTSFKNSAAKSTVRKITDSGFIFNPKTTTKAQDESKLLKSRYFSWTKNKEEDKKQIKSENDRRKDESYDDYMQRLYNEYFPPGENESEDKGSKDDDNSIGVTEEFCSSCRSERTDCACSKENLNTSDLEKTTHEDIKNIKRKSPEHCLLDEIYKSETTKPEEATQMENEEENSGEKVSPSSNLSFNFAKLLSRISETPIAEKNFETDLFEKENTEVTLDHEEPPRSPSPVFRVQREAKILNRNCRLGNVSDTAGTPTSIYFSSCGSEPTNKTNSQMSSRRTPVSSHRKMPSVRSFSSVPSKSGKNNLKSSTVNRTLFQFGFKKERRDESDSKG